MAAASIALSDLSAAEAKRLPRYPTVPAVLIGRLAVDERFQGRGLGAALVADAAPGAVGGPGGGVTVFVGAKNDRAAAFYRRLGFRPLMSRPGSLYLPLATAERAFWRRADG